MHSCNCTPESHPHLPPTHQHTLWRAWDLALDHVMVQLPDLLEGKKEYEVRGRGERRGGEKSTREGKEEEEEGGREGGRGG